MDKSNGYEGIASEFLRGHNSPRSPRIGVPEVSRWARSLPSEAAVIDLGCGSGVPITQVLVSRGLNVFAIDAAPSFVQAFQSNFPEIPISCEAVEESTFFGRTFDGIVAWGLIFLLQPEAQTRLICRFAEILEPGGRLLFTSPAKPVVWQDAMTGLESRSLGAHAYREQLSAVGLSVMNEYDDEGHNHYFEVL